MKKLLLLLCCAIGAPLLSPAQTPLPYYTGFNNATERAGWAQFAKGNMTSETWNYGPWSSLSSSPYLLVSPNAEFNSSAMTDTIDQWMVSPPFYFTSGGHIDSMSIAVFGATGTAQPTDSIVVYLLKGSQNPSLATSRTRLANLTTMAKGFGLSMRDTGNFVIPPTSGSSYIAFRYYGIYDWFQVYIDSVYISANAPTGITELPADAGIFSLYPNPAAGAVSLQFAAGMSGSATVDIVNMLGQVALSQKIEDISRTATIDIAHLPAGIYHACITTAGRQVAFRRSLIVH
ncbi:hypothetical protein GCM10023093_16330 [Nemorincola caseinilytica]|uniref:Secretion system C-terminal sorting domain-containing protein n=1 Tax=Nemorincola caseinilytica TaxID=2054315 RepID=A0ABP8NCG6_9BACT